nr:PREDICTED: uncharacterized protein LOC105678736 isoform X1 [Linepithema humile]
MNFISVIARTTNMRLQRYSNVYLLIPLYYTLAAVNAQVVTEESNIGFISGNITTANDVTNDLNNIIQCLNNITYIGNIFKFFGQIMNVFFLLPETFQDYTITILNYILENAIEMIRRTKITPISALAMLEAMTMLKGMRYEKRYLQ